MANELEIDEGDHVTHIDNGKSYTVVSVDHTRKMAVVVDEAGHKRRFSATRLNGDSHQGPGDKEDYSS